MRNCNKCIHHTAGACEVWECEEKTVEDIVNETKADTLKPFKSFIEEWDGAVAISDSLGVVSGQTLIEVLKEIVKLSEG